MGFVSDILGYAKENKKLWVLPLLFVFLALGALLVLTQGSVIAPFIYILF